MTTHLDDQDRRRRGTAAGRLHERDEVMAAIERLFHDERRDRSAVLLVEGLPGFGKTSVCNIARDRAETDGWTVRSVQCRPSDTSSPHSTAASLCSLRAEDVADAPDPWAVRRRLTASLATAVMSTGGLLLVVDEARLADEESCEWFLDLAARPPTGRFAMLFCAGPRWPGEAASAIDSLAVDPHVQRLPLRALSESAVATLVHERVGHVVAPRELAAAVVDATKGSPFLVHRAISELVDRPVDPRRAVEDGRWCIPSAVVAGWTLSRTRDLPSETLGLLRAVAVLGEDATVASVAEVAEVFGGAGDVDELVEALAARDVLERSRPLQFVYPLVAASIYAEIPPSARAQAHALAAAHLAAQQRPDPVVATHLLHTEPLGRDSTVRVLLSAARQAVADGALGVASHLLDRCAWEPPSDESMPSVLALRAQVAADEPGGEALVLLRAGFDVATDDAAVVAGGLAVIDGTADLARARAVTSLLLGAARASSVTPSQHLDLAIADAVLSGSALARHRLDEARRESVDEGVLAIAEVTARVLRAEHAHDVGFERWSATSRDSLPVGRLTGRVFQHVFHQVISLLVGGGDPANAIALLDRAAEVPDLPADTLAWNKVLRAEAEASRGQLVLAERLLRDVAARVESYGTVVAAVAEYRLGALMELRGETLPITAPADLSSRVDPEIHRWQRLRLLQADAACRAAHRDWSGARVVLRSAQDLASVIGVENPALATWRSGLVSALVATGQLQLASRHAEDELAAASAARAPLPIARALRLVAGLTESAERRVALLEQAEQLLADRPLVLDRTITLVQLGRARRDVGDEIRSRDDLRAAADAAVRMGAGSLMTAAYNELVVAGARPRRLARSGIAALTPAERKVAGMAANGQKNTEISAELFISVKTVESHLARVYRKLEVDGRTTLAAQWPLLVSVVETY